VPTRIQIGGGGDFTGIPSESFPTRSEGVGRCVRVCPFPRIQGRVDRQRPAIVDGRALGGGLKPLLHPDRKIEYAAGMVGSTSSNRKIDEGRGGGSAKIAYDPGGVGVSADVGAGVRSKGGPIGESDTAVGLN